MINIVRNPIAITGKANSPWKNKTGESINSLNIIAGNGISIDYRTSGQVINVIPDSNLIRLNFVGNYDFNNAYNVGDVVNVTGSFINQDSQSVPIGSTTMDGYDPIPTAIGTFVCVQYVPPSLYDEDYVQINVLPQFPGDAIPDEWINGTRFYEYNVYYPIYPSIPTQYTASVNVFDNANAYTIANNVFWREIGIPAIPMGGCVNKVFENFYVSAIQSGSVFLTASYLPYSV